MKDPFLTHFLGLKTQCTTLSVEIAYHFDHKTNLKPLNLQFRQKTTGKLEQNLNHGLQLKSELSHRLYLV